MSEKGLIMVFTGNGKGKTTSALGQAVRAMGHGYKVCIIQFIKGAWAYGELEALKRFDDLLEFHVEGNGFTWQSKDVNKDRAKAREAWSMAQKKISSNQYDMVILDEFTYLHHFRMIDADDIAKMMAQKPRGLHLVITGRYAPKFLIDHADLVSDIQEVRHPYKSGIMAQKGIEF